ncbi:MAG: hypothetical protein ACOCP6_02330 [Desulfosalsimonas sp.]
MAVFTSRKKPRPPRQTFLVKRCPECFVSLPIDAKRCFSCKSKVGGVDRHGKAKRPVNWYSYLTCILAWAALIFYIRWAFF